MKKIRMGFVGLGGIAEYVHIPGTIKSPDAEVVAVCDIKEDVLKAKGDKFGVPEAMRFTSYKDMIRHADIDAVSICTPNDVHFEVAVEAMNNGKPFAIEKPITTRYKEAKQLKEMALEKKIPNMVCFSYRFKPAARYARWLVQNGSLGKIYHIYGQYLQEWAMSEEVPLVWRFKKDASGSGALGDLGSHMIDLTRFIVGDFEKVCSHAGTFIHSRKEINSDSYGTVDVDDYCHYLAELKGGVSGSFEISRYAYARGNYQRVEVYGSKGALIYNLEDTDTLQVCIGDVYKSAKAYVEVPVPQQFKCDQMQSFFDIINGRGDGLAATIEDGAVNQLIVDGIIEAFEKEKWIYLKE